MGRPFDQTGQRTEQQMEPTLSEKLFYEALKGDR